MKIDPFQRYSLELSTYDMSRVQRESERYAARLSNPALAPLRGNF